MCLALVEAAALPVKAFTLDEVPGTKALAEVETVAAIANATRVLFIDDTMVIAFLTYLSSHR